MNISKDQKNEPPIECERDEMICIYFFHVYIYIHIIYIVYNYLILLHMTGWIIFVIRTTAGSCRRPAKAPILEGDERLQSSEGKKEALRLA